MAHVRKQIRDAVVTKVTGLATTGTNVFKDAVYPIVSGKLPGIVVSDSKERINRNTLAPVKLLRTLLVHIEGYATAATGLNDTLDTVLTEVETAMATDLTLGGLALDVELTGADKEISGGDSDKPVGYIRMTYEITYRTAIGSPETSV